MSMAPNSTLSDLTTNEVARRPAVPQQTMCGMTRMLRNALFARLELLQDGQLTFVDPDGTRVFGVAGRVLRPGLTPLQASVRVNTPEFYRSIALGGSVGAGEAYMRGEWDADDLTAVMRILVRNREVLDALETGWAALTRPALKLYHTLRRNTRTGSRRNIAAHYDLGNDFFRLMLDETMMYSSAIFDSPETSLYDAQCARLNRICERLELKPTDHLLEIGTGWGGMALHAAQQFGCRVTTTTISREQYQLALQRVADAGLSDRVTVMLSDYRDLQGQYDKLVSIEMIEAVGHQFYPEFFRACMRLLKPEGLMLIQAINIRDHYFKAAVRRVDFIQRHIFPGATIPSITALCSAAAEHSDFLLTQLDDITPHYAETLRRWRINFQANMAQISELGYSKEFCRMWDYYLCYCEGGFEERQIGDIQMLFARPLYR